jgi:hypothetical protein
MNLPMPVTVSDVEADCGHTECTAILFAEILRMGRWPVLGDISTPEDICMVAERREDARAETAAVARGEYQNHYGRRG